MTKRKKYQYLHNRTSKSGTLPGVLIQKPENAAKAEISLFQYNAVGFTKTDPYVLQSDPEREGYVTWINIDGVQDTDALEKAGSLFKLHPLLVEDIASIDQRPKVDDYGDNLFMTLKMLELVDDTLISDQVSFVMGKNYLLTFQEKAGDCFDSVRDRISNNKGKIRNTGPDYLMYSLLDIIVDQYYVVLENTSEKIEALENELIKSPQQSHLEEIYSLKNDALYLKKQIWPLRELISKLIREENTLIKPETRFYLKDVYDHCVHVIETIESYRDLLASMMDLYLNSVNNKLNEVMKILTVISTIFIPLTFLTSLYGMNFKYMPELDLKYSYPVLIVLMLCLGTSLLLMFRRKRWL